MNINQFRQLQGNADLMRGVQTQVTNGFSQLPNLGILVSSGKDGQNVKSVSCEGVILDLGKRLTSIQYNADNLAVLATLDAENGTALVKEFTDSNEVKTVSLKEFFKVKAIEALLIPKRNSFEKLSETMVIFNHIGVGREFDAIERAKADLQKLGERSDFETFVNVFLNETCKSELKQTVNAIEAGKVSGTVILTEKQAKFDQRKAELEAERIAQLERETAELEAFIADIKAERENVKVNAKAN